MAVKISNDDKFGRAPVATLNAVWLFVIKYAPSIWLQSDMEANKAFIDSKI